MEIYETNYPTPLTLISVPRMLQQTTDGQLPYNYTVIEDNSVADPQYKPYQPQPYIESSVIVSNVAHSDLPVEPQIKQDTSDLDETERQLVIDDDSEERNYTSNDDLSSADSDFDDLPRRGAKIKGRGRRKKGSGYECKICHKLYGLRKYLKIHYLTHSDCPRCRKPGRNVKHLVRHVRYCMSLDEYKKTLFMCEVCGKEFVSNHRLEKHKISHTDERPFKCAECEASYKTKQMLEAHHNVIHLNIKKYKCTTCGKCFGAHRHWKSHQMVHSDDRPYACHICGNRFKMRGNLKVHIAQMHNGIYPHMCDFCGVGYTHSAYLRLHIGVHMDAADRRFTEPMACELCDETVNRTRDAVHKHIKTHVNKKPEPVPCTECGKMMSSVRALRSHMKNKHTAEEIRCTECDFRCDSKLKMVWHRKKLHATVVPEPILCQFCPSKFHNQKRYETHLLRVHDEIDQIDIIKTEINGGREMPAEVVTITTGNRFPVLS